jgi:transcriptional regulator GlxA family with amidase domain
MSLKYGVFIYEEVAELDFVGPFQVFGMSIYISQNSDKLYTVSEDGNPVTCTSGLKVTPDFGFDDAPQFDVVVVPGSTDVETQYNNPKVLGWLKEQEKGARFMTAVCNGTLILQKAGLLDGRKATTHQFETDKLVNDPRVTALPEMRYVRDGNIITSQGVSAGIDMALWLAGELYTPDHAREIRKIMQYDPAPPYTAEV